MTATMTKRAIYLREYARRYPERVREYRRKYYLKHWFEIKKRRMRAHDVRRRLSANRRWYARTQVHSRERRCATLLCPNIFMTRQGGGQRFCFECAPVHRADSQIQASRRYRAKLKEAA